MCGLAISILTDDPPERVRAALDRMAHRGPDGRDISDFGSSAIGSVRLAVRGDPNAPPKYRDAVAGNLAFNGEIYRHPLDRGIPTCPQEELGALLAAQAAGKEPDGMYVFVRHDEASGEVVCLRDRFGIKPLFYCRSETGFDLASEVVGLPRKRGRDLVDRSALIDTLIGGRTMVGQTPRRSIFELPPGGEMRIEPNGFADVFVPDLAMVDDDDRPIADALWDSVEACGQTNGKIALALSGGLDSVAIAFALDALGFEDVHVFTVIVEGNEDGVRDLIELGLPAGGAWRSWHLHQVEVTGSAYVDLMARAVCAIDTPHRMSSAALVLALAEAIQRAGIKVVLTGEGPDELDFGYAGHAKLARELAAGRVVADRAEALLRHLCPPDLQRQLATIIDRSELTERLDALRMALKPFAAMTDARALQEVELRYSLAPLLHRSDHCFMAASVEARMPFLHGGYPQAAMRAAESKPLAHLLGKRRLRDALRGILPDRYVEMPKRPFRAPIGTWANEQLGDRLLEQIIEGAGSLESFGLRGLDRVRLSAMRAAPAGPGLLFALANLVRWIDWENRE